MNPSRLPPLTKAQQARVKLHRQEWKNIAKLSIVRKGQTKGHVCITAVEPDKTRRMWYGPDGELVRMVIERPLFTLSVELAEPESALTHET
jgi:hypothetical protein